MGVAVRGRFDRLQGQTDELVNWITKVRVKKNTVKRWRKKDLRVEAVLTNALAKAEMELRLKQRQRYLRWQRVKSELYKATNRDDCSSSYQQLDVKTCEDLSSLDSFMSMLKEVKIPLQR